MKEGYSSGMPSTESPTPAGEGYKRGMRSSVVGLAVNLCLACLKLTAGVVGTSYALIADAIESLGDSVGSLIVWRGLKIAARPPDHNHPYGHGKAEPLAALLVAILLAAAAGGIAVQALREIALPHRMPAPFTLAVLLGVVLVKEILYRSVLRVGKAVGSHAVYADAWHHRSDAITSGLAAVGITVALVGGHGFETADAWAALLASSIILVTAWRILQPAVQELMDHTASPDLVEAVRVVAESRARVHRVEKLFIRKMGLYYIADMHLEVPPEMSVRESHKLAHDVKEDVQHALPQVVEVLIHVEPAWPDGRPPDA
jgi:cation diffusion facilitator family transporter